MCKEMPVILINIAVYKKRKMGEKDGGGGGGEALGDTIF
jgi:hypothetical protein